jgi:xylulokinase
MAEKGSIRGSFERSARAGFREKGLFVPNVYLGIDIGTSGTKSLAIDESGKILASASAEYPAYHPKPGWSEQHPTDWWDATVATIGALLKRGKIRKGDVRGIGLSGQMHGSVFLDKNHEVIRPALLWNDQRTAAECAEIEKLAGGRKKLIEMVSNPALTGFTAPKILWLRHHEPKRFDQTRKVLLPKDYVRFRLTGEFATEVSDASGTLLLDVKKRGWSKALLSKLQLDGDLLPKCYESVEVSGRLSAAAAAATGLAEGTPVVGGGGDQAAGAVGNGIVQPGVISATLGTSGVVFAHAETSSADPAGRLHTFCHAVPGKWHQMGVILSAGGSLQWYRRQLANDLLAEAKRRKVDPYEVLTERAAAAPLGSEGLFFLPYLTGERTPHADPNARGAWIGLSPRHTQGHLIRAVMEGVTYAMRDSLELIRGLGVSIHEIRASGGGARSELWRQMQADIYGAPVVTINASEGPAFGVALLAATGTGAYDSIEQACDATIDVVSRTRPTKKAKDFYDQGYRVYADLYPSLRNSFAQIAAIAQR